MLNSQFIKFLIVGALNTLFGYGVYAVLIWFGLNYFSALTLSTILGVLFNFKTIGSLVFKSRSNLKIFKFCFVYFFLFAVNVMSVKLLLAYGLNSYFAGALTILPLAMLSFFLNKYFVFRGDL